MTVSQVKNNDTLTISVAGRMDTTTAPQLEAVIDSELGGVKTLYIDMSALEYISSAGLRVLLKAQKIMNKQGKMEIKNINDTIREIFEVTGFCDILTIA